MNIIFAGFGKLGLSSLNLLIDAGYRVDYILTHKSTDDSTSLTSVSEKNSIPYSTVDLRKNPEVKEKIIQRKADIFISINYRYIIEQEVLDSFKIPMNIHGSLLPRYRGRTPHVWAIINGENQAGVTCHIMDAGVDTGPIIHQVPVPIDKDDSGADLLEKYEKVYPECLRRSLEKISQGYEPEKQDHSQATYFGKRTPDMGYIDITKSKTDVLNFIRAQRKPYPGAYFYLSNGKRIIIHSAKEFVPEDSLKLITGSIVEFENSYLLSVADGVLMIQDHEIE